MPKSTRKTVYSLKFIVILAVFFFVFFNLIFRLILDMRLEAERKEAQRLEAERIKQHFIASIDKHYEKFQKLYQAREYEKAIDIIKLFNKYEKSDYKDLAKIKKEIRMVYLKKKLDFLPKVNLDEYMRLSKDIDIEDDRATEVFIRKPRLGQYFYSSDFPIVFEGVALSISGDFSDRMVWTSSIDGDIGTGRRLLVANLSIGEHEITATGSNGTTKGSMSTRIIVENDPDFLKKYRRN